MVPTLLLHLTLLVPIPVLRIPICTPINGHRCPIPVSRPVSPLSVVALHGLRYPFSITCIVAPLTVITLDRQRLPITVVLILALLPFGLLLVRDPLLFRPAALVGLLGFYLTLTILLSLTLLLLPGVVSLLNLFPSLLPPVTPILRRLLRHRYSFSRLSRDRRWRRPFLLRRLGLALLPAILFPLLTLLIIAAPITAAALCMDIHN